MINFIEHYRNLKLNSIFKESIILRKRQNRNSTQHSPVNIPSNKIVSKNSILRTLLHGIFFLWEKNVGLRVITIHNRIEYLTI